MGSMIHAAVLAAMKEAARSGIAKDSHASLGGGTVNYRGIEAAMNTMTGILARNSITVSPTYTDAQIMERVKGDPKDGKATRFALVRGSFVFSHAEDGSSVSCACYGEAMDSGDKAMTKAQSVAFRTALFQFFVIPTVSIDPESDGDDSEGAEPQALGLDAVKLMLDNIASSKTSERLQAVWVDAQALAGSAKDATALKEFKDAITARLKEIRGARE